MALQNFPVARGVGPSYPGPSPNSRHSYQSFGAAASGNQHRFTLYNPTGSNVSQHPLQRQGVVTANAPTGHQAAGSPDSYGNGPPVPSVAVGWPPVLNPVGSARDPAMMI